jgi:isoleucyl-tRNA synthetase
VPNFRALGPRLGPRVNEVKAALAGADGSALQARLEADGFIEVAGERLTADDVEVRATRHEAFALAEEGGWAVALDLELDDDLRREGLARELVRSLNDLRKEIGLAVSDRVAVAVVADGPVADAVAHHHDYVAAEVLAVELTVEAPEAPDDGHGLTVDGHPVRVTLTRR